MPPPSLLSGLRLPVIAVRLTGTSGTAPFGVNPIVHQSNTRL
jgi:hypothetical protein